MKRFTGCIAWGILLFLAAGQIVAQEAKSENAPRLSPNVTEEMRTPQFWISNLKGNPDQVVLTPAQISELNRKNRTKPYQFTDISGKKYSPLGRNSYLTDDPLSIKSIPGDSVRAIMDQRLTSFERGTSYDFRKKKLDYDAKKKLIDQTRHSEIPAVITPRYGILVCASHNMKYPTASETWPDPESWIMNNSFSALDAASPVAVLHTSRDGDWYYVRSEIHFGWVPAAHVALGSAQEIRDYVNARDFIVVTGGKVPVYSDRNPEVFITDLYMGARVRLARKAADGYHVLVPFRRADGSFEAAPGFVKPGAPMSVGYQPFTRRNIINTFFSKLDDPWSGGDYLEGRHCCGTIRGLLRTFGISVLNSTTFQLHASDHVYSFPKDASNEVKYSYLSKCEPAVTLLGSPAHVILYLGAVNGRHYVIHSTGYDYKSADGTTMLLRRVNVNDTELEGGSQVNTLTYMCELKP
ncbi:MAG: SH3 domain-containing protein [Candidatus Latescibacterota bacterium]